LSFVTTFYNDSPYSMRYKGGQEMSTMTLDNHITAFLTRKGGEFPELGLMADRLATTTKY